MTLARELGLLHDDPQAVSAFRREAQRRARREAEIKPFEAWRETRIREVSNRHYSLSKTASLASKVLSEFFDCEEGWNALARFYHAEAQLSAAFDWLMFSKASVWLEADSTPVDVFETWRNHAA